MWGSRSQKSYQRIDDDYGDAERQANTCSSIFPIVATGRNLLFGGGPSHTESSPLISGSSTPGDGYHSPPLNHVVGESRPDESGLNPSPPVMSSSSRRSKHHWDHIEDPDRFFTLVYEYHQGGGFLTIALKKMFSLAQFVFVVTFSTFFTQCIDYDVLFANKNVTSTGDEITGKRSFNDAVIRNCSSHLHPLVVFSILVAITFWISRVVKTTYYLLQLHEIQLFYSSELRISDAQLSNLTWHAVVKRICEVQKRLQLIVDREHVTPTDLYNRILRFKNYLVALVNARILPPRINVPFVGSVPYFPNGLKSNLRRILFFGSTSPWSGPYLKTEYKDLDNLEALTRQMEKDVAMYGFLNMIFFPLIFLYQVLFSFFTLSELIKRRQDALGMRRYSNYGRYRVRHFNELNHELNARLNRSHIYANAYLNQFYSTLTEIFAKNIAFVAGAIAGVLTILSAWDEDVLQVEHVLTVISVCGILIVVCHGLISDENLVWQPEVLLTNVASELHYVPSEWKGQAHTDKVRREFEQLFQLKWVFLLHELSSPILTPFILLFWIRPNCRELVRFFHDNTVRVEGLGDICSFALMDVGRHGDGKWNGSASVSTSIPAYDGKTELSVLHFASTNPEWKPPPASEHFLQRFKARLDQDLSSALHSGGVAAEKNLLLDSVHSLMPSVKAIPQRNPIIGNGLHRIDGPLDSIGGGILSTLYQTNPEAVNSLTRSLQHSSTVMDAAGVDMRIKTLFLRGMHDESLRRSSITITDYGASMAPHQMQSIFGVPQPSQMAESVTPEDDTRSRLVLRSSLPVASEEQAEDEESGSQNEDEDDDGPPKFMNV
ncbi:Autophagy- protein 9 [Parelaphostrongylus tenuis]|uniref:Autophagy-related protein 9 n=1 Tax=Parelaphostrongylus tenuis TaxID=148309 RepID=A0AAD5RDI9_PARTN|nr:Autophagy- protein 9 [Parelaphostrongylus tenuis]